MKSVDAEWHRAFEGWKMGKTYSWNVGNERLRD
jgi:hypothetical protein